MALSSSQRARIISNASGATTQNSPTVTKSSTSSSSSSSGTYSSGTSTSGNARSGGARNSAVTGGSSSGSTSSGSTSSGSTSSGSTSSGSSSSGSTSSGSSSSGRTSSGSSSSGNYSSGTSTSGNARSDSARNSAVTGGSSSSGSTSSGSTSSGSTSGGSTSGGSTSSGSTSGGSTSGGSSSGSSSGSGTSGGSSSGSTSSGSTTQTPAQPVIENNVSYVSGKAENGQTVSGTVHTDSTGTYVWDSMYYRNFDAAKKAGAVTKIDNATSATATTRNTTGTTKTNADGSVTVTYNSPSSTTGTISITTKENENGSKTITTVNNGQATSYDTAVTKAKNVGVVTPIQDVFGGEYVSEGLNIVPNQEVGLSEYGNAVYQTTLMNQAREFVNQNQFNSNLQNYTSKEERLISNFENSILNGRGNDFYEAIISPSITAYNINGNNKVDEYVKDTVGYIATKQGSIGDSISIAGNTYLIGTNDINDYTGTSFIFERTGDVLSDEKYNPIKNDLKGYYGYKLDTNTDEVVDIGFTDKSLDEFRNKAYENNLLTVSEISGLYGISYKDAIDKKIELDNKNRNTFENIIDEVGRINEAISDSKGHNYTEYGVNEKGEKTKTIYTDEGVYDYFVNNERQGSKDGSFTIRGGGGGAVDAFEGLVTVATFPVLGVARLPFEAVSLTKGVLGAVKVGVQAGKTAVNTAGKKIVTNAAHDVGKIKKNLVGENITISGDNLTSALIRNDGTTIGKYAFNNAKDMFDLDKVYNIERVSSEILKGNPSLVISDLELNGIKSAYSDISGISTFFKTAKSSTVNELKKQTIKEQMFYDPFFNKIKGNISDGINNLGTQNPLVKSALSSNTFKTITSPLLESSLTPKTIGQRGLESLYTTATANMWLDTDKNVQEKISARILGFGIGGVIGGGTKLLSDLSLDNKVINTLVNPLLTDRAINKVSSKLGTTVKNVMRTMNIRGASSAENTIFDLSQASLNTLTNPFKVGMGIGGVIYGADVVGRVASSDSFGEGLNKAIDVLSYELTPGIKGGKIGYAGAGDFLRAYYNVKTALPYYRLDNSKIKEKFENLDIENNPVYSYLYNENVNAILSNKRLSSFKVGLKKQQPNTDNILKLEGEINKKYKIPKADYEIKIDNKTVKTSNFDDVITVDDFSLVQKDSNVIDADFTVLEETIFGNTAKTKDAGLAKIKGIHYKVIEGKDFDTLTGVIVNDKANSFVNPIKLIKYINERTLPVTSAEQGIPLFSNKGLSDKAVEYAFKTNEYLYNPITDKGYVKRTTSRTKATEAELREKNPNSPIRNGHVEATDVFLGHHATPYMPENTRYSQVIKGTSENWGGYIAPRNLEWFTKSSENPSFSLFGNITGRRPMYVQYELENMYGINMWNDIQHNYGKFKKLSKSDKQKRNKSTSDIMQTLNPSSAYVTGIKREMEAIIPTSSVIEMSDMSPSFVRSSEGGIIRQITRKVSTDKRAVLDKQNNPLVDAKGNVVWEYTEDSPYVKLTKYDTPSQILIDGITYKTNKVISNAIGKTPIGTHIQNKKMQAEAEKLQKQAMKEERDRIRAEKILEQKRLEKENIKALGDYADGITSGKIKNDTEFWNMYNKLDKKYNFGEKPTDLSKLFKDTNKLKKQNEKVIMDDIDYDLYRYNEVSEKPLKKETTKREAFDELNKAFDDYFKTNKVSIKPIKNNTYSSLKQVKTNKTNGYYYPKGKYNEQISSFSLLSGLNSLSELSYNNKNKVGTSFNVSKVRESKTGYGNSYNNYQKENGGISSEGYSTSKENNGYYRNNYPTENYETETYKYPPLAFSFNETIVKDDKKEQSRGKLRGGERVKTGEIINKELYTASEMLGLGIGLSPNTKSYYKNAGSIISGYISDDKTSKRYDKNTVKVSRQSQVVEFNNGLGYAPFKQPVFTTDKSSEKTYKAQAKEDRKTIFKEQRAIEKKAKTIDRRNIRKATREDSAYMNKIRKDLKKAGHTPAEQKRMAQLRALDRKERQEFLNRHPVQKALATDITAKSVKKSMDKAVNKTVNKVEKLVEKGKTSVTKSAGNAVKSTIKQHYTKQSAKHIEMAEKATGRKLTEAQKKAIIEKNKAIATKKVAKVDKVIKSTTKPKAHPVKKAIKTALTTDINSRNISKAANKAVDKVTKKAVNAYYDAKSNRQANKFKGRINDDDLKKVKTALKKENREVAKKRVATIKKVIKPTVKKTAKATTKKSTARKTTRSSNTYKNTMRLF